MLTEQDYKAKRNEAEAWCFRQMLYPWQMDQIWNNALEDGCELAVMVRDVLQHDWTILPPEKLKDIVRHYHKDMGLKLMDVFLTPEPNNYVRTMMDVKGEAQVDIQNGHPGYWSYQPWALRSITPTTLRALFKEWMLQPTHRAEVVNQLLTLMDGSFQSLDFEDAKVFADLIVETLCNDPEKEPTSRQEQEDLWDYVTSNLAVELRRDESDVYLNHLLDAIAWADEERHDAAKFLLESIRDETEKFYFCKEEEEDE